MGTTGMKGIRANEVGNEQVNNTNDYNSKLESFANDILATEFKNRELANRRANKEIFDPNNISNNDFGTSKQLYLDEDPLAEFGQSKYDREAGVMFNANADAIQNNRFERQSALTQIGTGVAKGIITAGTTFVDGLAMFSYGLIKGAYNRADNDPTTGFLDGMWNNEITQTMNAINNWSEETFKNYYSTNQERNTWSKDNVLSANFLGDKMLKNMGFMVGAYGSGAVLTAGKLLPRAMAVITKKATGSTMKAVRALKSTAMVEGSAISAVSEGGIEALTNSTEWKKLQVQQLEDDTKQKLQDLELSKDLLTPEQYAKSKQQIQDAHYKTMQRIDEDAVRMGNLDLLINLPILTAENVFAWGRLYASGFRNSTRSAGKGIARNQTNDESKTAIQNLIGVLETKTKKPTLKGIGKTALRSASESNEEMAQAWASEYAGLREQQDVNGYHKAILNGEAYERTYDGWKSAVEAWYNTYGNADRWEEGLIGALSSIFGMPKMRGVKNDKTGKFQSPISFEGGLIEDIKESRKESARAQTIIDYINNRMGSTEFEKQFKGLVGHNFWQSAMDNAAEKGDKLKFKDFEAKQFINDIFMLHQAGLLDNAEAFVKLASDISLADLDTEDGKTNFEFIKENDKIKDENGNVIGSQRGWFSKDGKTQLKSDPEIIKEIQERSKEKILAYINEYKKVVEELDYDTSGTFSDDQLMELGWYKMNKFAALQRNGSILNNVKNPKKDDDPDLKQLRAVIDQKIKNITESKNLNKEELEAIKDEKKKEALLEKLNSFIKSIDEFSNLDFSKLSKMSDEEEYNDYVSAYNGVRDAVVYLNQAGFKSKWMTGFNREFKDADKLFATAWRYDQLYQDYLKNPNLLEDQIIELKKQAENAHIEKAARDIEEKLKGLPTATSKDLLNFRRVLEEELSKLRSNNVEYEEVEKYKINKVSEILSNSSTVKDTFNKINKQDQVHSFLAKAYEEVINDDNYLSKSYGDRLITELNFKYKVLDNLDSFFTEDDIKNAINDFINTPIGSKEFSAKELIKEFGENVLDKFNAFQESSLSFQKSETQQTEPDKQDSKNLSMFDVKSEEKRKIQGEANKMLANADNKINEIQTLINSGKYDQAINEINNVKNALNALDQWLTDGDFSDSDKKPLDARFSILSQLEKNIENSRNTPVSSTTDVVTFNSTEPAVDEIDDDTNQTSTQIEVLEEQQAAAALEEMDKGDQPPVQTILNLVKNWMHTLWNYNSLKSSKRKLEEYRQKDNNGNDLPISTSVEFINKAGGLEFVDRGLLAAADMRYQKRNDNKKLPIRFLCTNTIKNTRKDNGRPAPPDVFMAIELTKDITDRLDGLAIEPITIDGKQYLPVGVVSYYNNDGQDPKKNPSRDLWLGITNTVLAEYKQQGEPKYFISSYTSEVSRYYSGRIVLTDNANEISIDRTLKNSPFNSPEKLKIGIARSNTNGEIYAPQLGAANYRRLNSNNPGGLRAGSVWIMVRGADGIYYPTGTRVARFNSEFNWRDHRDTPIVDKIIKLAKAIVDTSLSDKERWDARNELERYIAFPKKPNTDTNEKHHVILDKKDGKDLVSIKGNHRQINNDEIFNKLAEDASVEDRADAFLDALTECNYRFNVNTTLLKSEDENVVNNYLQMLIDSDIISTNLLKDHNYCSSFELSSLKNSKGEIEFGVDREKQQSPENTRTYTTQLNNKFTFSLNGNTHEITIVDDKIIVPNGSSQEIKRAAELVYNFRKGAKNIGYVKYGTVEDFWDGNDNSLLIRVDKRQDGNDVYSVYNPKGATGNKLAKGWEARKEDFEKHQQENSTNPMLNAVSENIPSGSGNQQSDEEIPIEVLAAMAEGGEPIETGNQQPILSPAPQPTFFVADDKTLKPGSAVNIKDANGNLKVNDRGFTESFIYLGEENGKPFLVTSGTQQKYTGNVTSEQLVVTGNFKTATYNGNNFIVLNENAILSVKTGNLAYVGDDNSTKSQREQIVKIALTNPIEKISVQIVNNQPVVQQPTVQQPVAQPTVVTQPTVIQPIVKPEEQQPATKKPTGATSRRVEKIRKLGQKANNQVVTDEFPTVENFVEKVIDTIVKDHNPEGKSRSEVAEKVNLIMDKLQFQPNLTSSEIKVIVDKYNECKDKM